MDGGQIMVIVIVARALVASIVRAAAMTSVLSGESFEARGSLPLARLFADFPGALLHCEAT